MKQNKTKQNKTKQNKMKKFYLQVKSLRNHLLTNCFSKSFAGNTKLTLEVRADHPMVSFDSGTCGMVTVAEYTRSSMHGYE